MTAALATPRGRLRHYLLRWALGTLVVVWLALVGLAWSTGFHEARKFSDAQLIAVAQLWSRVQPGHADVATLHPENTHGGEYVHELAVIAWQGGVLVTDTHGLAGGIRPGALPLNGFATVDVAHAGRTGEWRAYAVGAGPGQRVVALMDMRERRDLGNDLARHVAQPALLVLPLVALLLWWAVRRGLAPLDRLSREVATLDGFAGQRLDAQHRFSEFASTVAAINNLVDTLQTRARREREFASDVAHELRTPLAALSLQAGAAQQSPTPERLQQLSDEALRAGRILAQLLDLARAQRAGGHAVEHPATDLVATAAAQVAAHAPDADRQGHELSLQAPSAIVAVNVPPMLVELALRNLIDNAVRHTPPGSLVLVQVWQDAQGVALSVSDDGQRRDGIPAVPARGPGLGLGLRLVERMAEEMGATLVRDAGEPPMTTRFVLRWGHDRSA